MNQVGPKRRNRARFRAAGRGFASILLWLLLFGGIVTDATAGVTVSGKIRDLETGESIPAVAVMVKGTTRGATANVEGFFSLPGLNSGEITLIFSALGYRHKEMKITLEPAEERNFLIDLVPEALMMGAVEIVIESAEMEEPKYSPQVAQIRVTAKDLKHLPQLAEADLFRSLQMMPGVLPSSDFSSELNIWGGSSDQNLILLNGVNVYKPTHMGGLFSVFNMDAIKDVKLIKGGFGAKYGGRLSAVVDIHDREGNRNEVHGKIGLSLLSSSATFEGPFPKGSWLVAGRRTYVDAATKLLSDGGVIDAEFPYYFYDFNAKLTRDFANGDRLTPSIYLGDDVLKLTSSTDDRIRVGWGNRTYSLPFVHIFSPKLFSKTTLSGSHFNANQRFESVDSWFEWENEIRDFTAKTDFTYYPNARNTFQFGAESKYLNADLFVQTDDRVFVNSHQDGNILALYLSDDYRLTDKWSVSPGFRWEYFSLTEKQEPQPRLGLRWDLNKGSHLSAAWGMYSQYLQLISFGSGFQSIFDSYAPLSDEFKPNRGQQYVLSYATDRLGPFQLSTDLYYKKFNNVIEFDFNTTDDNDDELFDLFRSGNGYAYGWDLLLQGDWDHYAMTLGYAIGRSRRSFEKFDNGLVYPTHFDRLHNSNILVTRKFGKRRTLEMRFNYGTGQPRTTAVAAYSAGLDLGPDFLVPGRRNNYRLPTYHRLDVSYRLRYEFSKWTFLPFIEIINVTNHKNVLTRVFDTSFNPATTNDLYQLPLLPTIGFTAEF